MDRRGFLGTCSAGAAGLSGGAAFRVWATDVKPRAYPPALLVDEHGEPLRSGALKPQVNYVFSYPYAATPAFLLDLGRPAGAHALSTQERDPYSWPGGVGRNRSIVAFSAICAHDLVYPTHEVSLISFRKTRAQRGVQDGLIHCCAEHSQFDPSRGAEVLTGPARQPLCAVLLTHDLDADTLTAHATLGGELFDAFFRKHEAKLNAEMGGRAREAVKGRTVVTELTRYCRNLVQC